MNLLEKVKIVENFSNHPFKIGEIVTIFRIFADHTMDVCGDGGECWRIYPNEVKTINMFNARKAVLDTANRLLKSQNKITTLEIKAELMKVYPRHTWFQTVVSAFMDSFHKEGIFTYYDTVTGGNQHRVYSSTGVKIRNVKVKKQTMATTTTGMKKSATASTKVSAPTTKTISKTKALELMANNKGHFFTATFIAKKGERTINCQYLKDQAHSTLGYVKVKEAIKAKAAKEAAEKARASNKKIAKPDCIRHINLQTLKSLKIAGNTYRVK